MLSAEMVGTTKAAVRSINPQPPLACYNDSSARSALNVAVRVSYVKGHVIHNKKVPMDNQLVRGELIYPGDFIKTGKNGFVRLRIGDQQVNVQPKSEFSIDRYLSNCSRATGDESRSLKVGVAHMSAAVRG